MRKKRAEGPRLLHGNFAQRCELGEAINRPQEGVTPRSSIDLNNPRATPAISRAPRIPREVAAEKPLARSRRSPRSQQHLNPSYDAQRALDRGPHELNAPTGIG